MKESMFTKLFSRITESSLMEEEIAVRYTFVMLLAICDPSGHVIGTDIAIARRLNMSLGEFQRCMAELAKPDPHSNSKEEDGRRVMDSDGERGYRIVNYFKYRDLKSEEMRRDYMRNYMADRRRKQSSTSRKPLLAKLTQEEVEAEEEHKPAKTPPPASQEGESFADWFRKLLPETIKLAASWRRDWAECYDKLIRIDGRTKEEVKQVCQWARSDAFWSANFHTPMKLRKRSGDGILFFDVFKTRIAATNKPAATAIPSTDTHKFKIIS